MHDLSRAAPLGLSLLFLLTCTSPPAEPVANVILPTMVSSTTIAPPVSSTPAPPVPEATPTLAPSAPVDPYTGWQNWCEPMHYETECQTHSDCVGITHISGRNDALKCLHPWWAEKNSPLRICNPGGSNRLERSWRYARLREIVSQLYFDEGEHCEWTWELEFRGKPARPREFHRRWTNGRPHWRCQNVWRLADRLTRFMSVPYGRETSKRPFKRHRLDPDAAANQKAWVKEADAYGWDIELACEVEGRSVKKCPRFRRGPLKGKKRLYIKKVEPDPEAKQSNPHYGDRDRWAYGLGPVGKNTGYGVQDWDPMAPPEILCLEVPGFEAYMRDARVAVRKFRGTHPPTCGGSPYRGHAIKVLDDGTEIVVDEPSWRDVHRVASAGAWCPKKSAKAEQLRRRFNKDMARVGLRPDEPVTEADMGHGLPREGQWRRAQEVARILDDLLPSPWEALVTSDPVGTADATSP